MIERTSTEIRAHRAEIDKIAARWVNREITLRQKRALIRDLNKFFYGDRTPTLSKRELVAATDEPERELIASAVAANAPALWDDDEDEVLWWQREGA